MKKTQSLFELALKAKLPVIAVQTTDTIHAMEIIEHLCAIEVGYIMNPSQASLRKVEHDVAVLQIDQPMSIEDLYALGSELEKVFILINPDITDTDVGLFDAGMLPTPRELVVEAIKSVIGIDTVSDKFMALLGGLTLKEVREVCLLAIAKNGSLTHQGVMELRSVYASRLRGLEQVDVAMPCYIPDGQIESWVKMNYEPFIHAEDPQLVPRGVLLNGVPGVGKSSAAKEISRMMGVPLYRMDVTAMMEKWQGESERFLRNALDQIDREEPCVLLIDEIEKVFQQGDSSDTGTSSRMLSRLLWWLQEHDTRVLTVMTTNDFEKLPPEVYRPGRIDKVIEIASLNSQDAIVLAKVVYSSLTATTRALVPQSKVLPKVRGLLTPSSVYTHSAVTTMVIDLTKQALKGQQIKFDKT